MNYKFLMDKIEYVNKIFYIRFNKELSRVYWNEDGFNFKRFISDYNNIEVKNINGENKIIIDKCIFDNYFFFDKNKNIENTNSNIFIYKENDNYGIVFNPINIEKYERLTGIGDTKINFNFNKIEYGFSIYYKIVSNFLILMFLYQFYLFYMSYWTLNYNPILFPLKIDLIN